MHMHIAGRHQRQAAGRAQGAQGFQARRIVRPGMQLDGDPGPARKAFGQPVPIGW